MKNAPVDARNGGTNPAGPTSRTTDEGTAKVTRAATTIDALIATNPSTSINKALESVPLPDMSIPCALPRCPNEVTWGQAGRATHFCSSAHRAAFSRERRNIERDLKAYERLRWECEPTQAQANQLNIRITALRRLLTRYQIPISTTQESATEQQRPSRRGPHSR